METEAARLHASGAGDVPLTEGGGSRRAIKQGINADDAEDLTTAGARLQ